MSRIFREHAREPNVCLVAVNIVNFFVQTHDSSPPPARILC